MKNCTDWEAIADRAPSELFSPPNEEGVPKLPSEDTKFQTPKRRGRGTFLYRKNGLYSDLQPDVATVDGTEDGVACHSSEANTKSRNCKSIVLIILVVFKSILCYGSLWSFIVTP